MSGTECSGECSVVTCLEYFSHASYGTIVQVTGSPGAHVELGSDIIAKYSLTDLLV